ncbi:hypothetical protein [Tellurirhabdus rosea]|uniref:hypothetical protein n=1 Tax=Tellurirhabdus rosea TaxID=2674997 RepID=UPI0022506CF0|nr:hypothetical protein [Tellurirhabdus rosea]
MKKYAILRYAIFWIGLTVILPACRDHAEPVFNQPRYRIDRVIQTRDSVRFVNHYLFNPDDLPVAVRRFSLPDSVRTLVVLPFTYQADSVRGFEQLQPGLDRPPVTGSFYQFHFNNKGQIVSRKTYYTVTPPGQPIRVSQENYEYDAEGNLIRLKQYGFAGLRTFFPNPLHVTVSEVNRISPTKTEIRSTNYSRNGQIGFTCMDCYLQEPASLTYGLERREYDTNINPFYGRYLISPNLEAFERANLVRREFYPVGYVNADWTPIPQAFVARSEFTYTYNADRLPVKRAIPGGAEDLQYVYKTY